MSTATRDAGLRAFARLLADARRERARLTALAPELAGLDAAQADAVQFATAELVGPVAALKVAQVGESEGSFGLIFADDLHASPCDAALGLAEIVIEIEVAFRFGRDLAPRASPYARAEVEAAVDAALPVFEVQTSRLPADPPPSAALARADRMNSLGLIVGAPVADWRKVVGPRLAIEMVVDGAAAVSQRGGHPSGDPFHPLVWLADALGRAGRGLRAGDIVTTGAYGGGHPMKAGTRARGGVEGFAPLDFALLP